MKTTITLMALYLAFGFFACKRDEEETKMVGYQVVPPARKAVATALKASQQVIPDAHEVSTMSTVR